ncbi:MAG: hypothetical protein H6701_15315 [Myxococcales bacterium]|nr:hypothetical protein [Myxococcales bacterium]
MQLRITALGLALPLAAVTARAQDTDYVPPGAQVSAAVEEQKKAAEQKPADGWTIKVELGLNGALTNTSGVVGTDDGNTVQFGIALKGQADLRAGDHEWRNELALAHAQTQTPALPVFVKGTDQLDLSSMYLYHIPAVPWLGPFARARMQTSIFSGRLVVALAPKPDPSAPDVQVVIDGGEPTELDTKTEDNKRYGFLELTDPFQPLLLRESAGVFAQPLDDKTLRLTVSLGAGAQQVFADGGRAVTDDAATPAIEVSSLNDSQQIGAEVDVTAGGAVTETIGYSLGVNVLYPFYSDPEATVGGKVLEGVELTNVEVSAKLSVKLAAWASLDYVLSAKYLPLIIDEWQVQHGLLLNSSFNLL